MSMSATGPPFFRQALPSVSHLVDSARPRSTSLQFGDPLEDEKDQEDDRHRSRFANPGNRHVVAVLPRMSQPMVIRNGCNYVAAHAVRVYNHRSSLINDP